MIIMLIIKPFFLNKLYKIFQSYIESADRNNGSEYLFRDIFDSLLSFNLCSNNYKLNLEILFLDLAICNLKIKKN